jgi:hypothetical protein
MENIDFKPMTYKDAEALACSECARLGCDVYIYRLRNGRFRVTSNKKTIPIGASIYDIKGAI